MCDMDNKKGKEKYGRLGIAESRNHQNFWVKRKLQVPGDIRSGQHETEREEIQSKKGIPEKNKKTSRNQIMLQTSLQRNVYLDSLPGKLLNAILKMDKGGIQMDQKKQGN